MFNLNTDPPISLPCFFHPFFLVSHQAGSFVASASGNQSMLSPGRINLVQPLT
jgi:hypothetical protein